MIMLIGNMSIVSHKRKLSNTSCYSCAWGLFLPIFIIFSLIVLNVSISHLVCILWLALVAHCLFCNAQRCTTNAAADVWSSRLIFLIFMTYKATVMALNRCFSSWSVLIFRATVVGFFCFAQLCFCLCFE